MINCGLKESSSGGVAKLMTTVEPLALLKSEENCEVYREKQLPT